MELAAAAPGDVVAVGALAPAPLARVSQTGGQLFYSNNPEAIPAVAADAPTLLCHNPVAAGPARCFVYHVNGAGRPAAVDVLLAPLAGPVAVQVRRRGLAAPAGDYVGIGRRVQADWFRSGAGWTLAVAGPTLLDPALAHWVGAPGDLFHGLWTWEAGGPLWVTVAARPAEQPAPAALDRFRLAPREGLFSPCPEDFRARGVFQGTKWVAAAYAGDLGPRFLPVGHRFCSGDPLWDTPTGDAWVPGRDETPRAPGDTAPLGPYLPGNYGVLYRFGLLLGGTAPVAVLLNPRGGVIHGAFRASPGLTPGGVTAYGPLASPDQAVLLGRYAPPALARLDLMPAGGANLPWRVLLVGYRSPAARRGR